VHPTPHFLATGDDDGTIKVSCFMFILSHDDIKCKAGGLAKLWDPRKQEAISTYTQHFDFISDFMWLQDKKQLVATRCVNASPPPYPNRHPLFHHHLRSDSVIEIVPQR